MNPLEIKIEEYIPLIKPTIIARAKSLMLPVVNTYKEITANKVVTVVSTERRNVSDKDLLRIELNSFASGKYLRM